MVIVGLYKFFIEAHLHLHPNFSLSILRGVRKTVSISTYVVWEGAFAVSACKIIPAPFAVSRMEIVPTPFLVYSRGFIFEFGVSVGRSDGEQDKAKRQWQALIVHGKVLTPENQSKFDLNIILQYITHLLIML